MKVGVIVVDLQGDFTEYKGGSLAVPGTDRHYIEKVQEVTERFKLWGALIIGTQDWHPPDHVSFYTNHPGKKAFEVIEIQGRKQTLWPPHCIQGTEGARILIDNNLFRAVVQKGRDPRFDSYSGFQDDGGNRTELDTILKINGVKRLIVYGLATDYCVRATAVDARGLGYEVFLLKDLCRGVAPDTTAMALEEMARTGIKILEGLNPEELRGLLT
ncbi:MAG: amidase [Deltaproteobacteria bacterium]|nr:MAG: amidase [Deltaproteobacteria bacterium]